MTATEQKLQQAAEYDTKADTLYMSLLAPSMRETQLRDAAKCLRDEVAQQEEAAAEFGRLARSL